MNKYTNMRGFTLIEIMVTVSIILILSSIGVPIYRGYLDDSKITLAKQNLNSIYLAETNYFYENNEYYLSGTTCGDHNILIINNLFQGQKIIGNDYFEFCIINNNDGYKAKAIEISGNTEVSIDHLNNITINSNS